MADVTAVRYLNDLKPGDRVRAKVSVRASALESGKVVNGRFQIAGFKRVTLPPGETVTFVKHAYGPGSDPAFEVTLRREDNSEVQVIVGWFHLRDDQFEVLTPVVS